MKKAIIIHGYHTKENLANPSKNTPSNHQWIPWLSKQLYMRDIFPIAIEMPAPWRPVYEDWKRELERFELDEDTILIGHSYGGGFLVRYLSENTVKVNEVYLVAPYMGADGVEVKDQDPTFFDFQIDQNLVNKTAGVIVFESSNDMPEIHTSRQILEQNIANLKFIDLENKGHFTIATTGTAEFPELAEEILRNA